MTPRDPTRPTTGDVTLAHLARLKRGAPLPWQWDVAAVAGELADDGVGFRYPIVVLHVPRRAGKSVLALAAALDRLDLIADARCWYTAQTRETAAKLFRDEWCPMLEPLSRLYRLRKSQGSEGVHKRRGSSRLQLFAPTPDALHSTNVDCAIVDEAWAFELDQGAGIESGLTHAQLTRRWRQTWIVSAGGTIASTWLDRWLTLAESAAPGVALFDYGAPPGADIADPDVWRAAHPAWGHTVDDAALRHEWDTRLDDASFARAILNLWPRPSTVIATAGVDLGLWAVAAQPAATVDSVAAIALDVAADRSSASIAVAGRLGDRIVVEVIDARPGVAWVAAAVKAVRAAHRGVPVVADALVAASIVAELNRARVTVEAVSGGDHARACGTFVDLLAAGALVHRAQAVLDDAVIGAARRPFGDAWLWSRSRSRIDISPLVAATLAVWVAHARRRTGRGAVVVAADSPAPAIPPGPVPRLQRPYRPRSA